MKWEELPIVRFMHELNNEEWFTAADGSFDLPLHRPLFSGPHDGTPTTVHCRIAYAGRQWEYQVYYANGKYSRNQKQSKLKNARRGRTTRSKYAYKIIESIARSFERVIEAADEAEEKQRQYDAYVLRCTQQLAKTSKALNIPNCKLDDVIGPPKQQPSPIMFTFICNLAKHYELYMSYNEASKTPIKIEQITGNFTMDEAANISKAITQCPSIMADRIKYGK
jgi:hypothetical protein